MTSVNSYPYHAQPHGRHSSDQHGHRYAPSGSPRVRFPTEDPAAAGMDRGRTHSRRPPPVSRDSTRSLSPSRSRPRSRHHNRSASRRRSSADTNEKKAKQWYQKKTVWTSIATLASVAAVIPTAVSATASVSSSRAANRAARASEISAVQTTKSANASQKAAKGSLMSAKAVTNSSVAQGHMDMYGRYTGPHGHVDAGRKMIGSGRRTIEAAGPPSGVGRDRVAAFR